MLRPLPTLRCKLRPISVIQRLSLTLLIVCLNLGLNSPAAHALYCRTVSGHEVCLVDVQRSAKNYWEYRAIVRIDGVEQPREVYNCRDRTKVQHDGRIVPFAPQGPGTLICQLLDR